MLLQVSLWLSIFFHINLIECLRFVPSSVCVYWMRSVLLGGVNFFSVYEIISMSLRHDILRKDSVLTWYLLLLSILVETHCHWWCHVLWTTHSSHTLNIVLIIVHFEYFLLLSSQVLWHLCASTAGWLTTSVHHCEPHGSWYENIILTILATTGRFNLRLVHEIIVVLNMVWWLTLCWRLVQCL